MTFVTVMAQQLQAVAALALGGLCKCANRPLGGREPGTKDVTIWGQATVSAKTPNAGSLALSGKQEAVGFGSHGANLEGRARGRGPDPGEPRAVPSQRRAGPEPYVRKPIWKMVRRGLKGWGVDRPGDLLGDLKQPRHVAAGTRM